MKRRTLLGLIAGATGGATLSIGTGAFSYTNADRSMTVEVVDDSEAYLELDETGKGERSIVDDGTIAFHLPAALEKEYGYSDAGGLGPDSIYRFDDDAGEDGGEGLFTIENRGTETVSVFSTPTDKEGAPSVAMVDVETGALLTEDAPSKPLDPGELLRAGVQVDTHGVDVRDDRYWVTLTINAEVSGA